MRLSRLAVDVAPLRESRDFRLLTAGSLITGLGTQATMVALPYQVYVTTGWAFLTGLLGAAELGPLIVASLFGGALAAAVAAGSTIAALTTGWLYEARFLGRIVLIAVAAWGAFVALAGISDSLWVAAGLFSLAGAADSVSAVCRSTISQTLTPDRMRGRMSSVFSLVVASGPRLGDIESAPLRR